MRNKIEKNKNNKYTVTVDELVVSFFGHFVVNNTAVRTKVLFLFAQDTVTFSRILRRGFVIIILFVIY